MNFSRFVKKAEKFYDFIKGRSKISYSQFGEDIIVENFFKTFFKKNNPTYFDIGTNDPVIGNNTYLLYTNQSFGVCVEPDPVLFEKIKSRRPLSVNINAGIGIDDATEGSLYIFPSPYTGWNTFSKAEAEIKVKQSGIQYKSIVQVPFISINQLIKEHFKSSPDFISIDVEGLDFEILKTIDFSLYRPTMFCIETTFFDVNHKGEKNTVISDFMIRNGYVVYADTYINTIFVRKELLQ